MTFSDIVTEVQDALARNDAAVTGKIPGWVNRRQDVAALRHDFAFMRVLATASTVAGQKLYGFPSDFKRHLRFYLQTATAYIRLPVRNEADMLATFSPTTTNAQPQNVTVETGSATFKLWPTPDAVYTLKLSYFSLPADLSGTQTNWLTVYAPTVLVAGATAEGLWFLGADNEAMTAEKRAEDAFQKAVVADGSREESEFEVDLEFDPRTADASIGDIERQLDDTA